MAAQQYVTSSSSSKHVTQKTDIFVNHSLSVKLRDKPLLSDSNSNPNSSTKNTSPISPFDVDFCSDEKCPESPYTPVTPNLNLKSEFESMNNKFEEINLQSEFKIDIRNDDSRNEKVNLFEDRGGNSKSSFHFDGLEKYLKIKRLFRKSEQPDKLNQRIKKLENSKGKDMFSFCSYCGGRLKQKRDVFIYMDKGFCNDDCRQIYMESDNNYQTLHQQDDDQLIPLSFYKHTGPTFQRLI